MQDWALVLVIPVVLALALYGLWDALVENRSWLVKHQPRTKRGRQLALAIGIPVVAVLLIGQYAEMFRFG